MYSHPPYAWCITNYQTVVQANKFPTKARPSPPPSTPDPPNLLARALPGRCPAEAERKEKPPLCKPDRTWPNDTHRATASSSPPPPHNIVACKAHLGLSASVHPSLIAAQTTAQ